MSEADYSPEVAKEHVEAALADPALASLRLSGAPVVVIAGAVISNLDILVANFATLALITVLFCVISLAVGYVVPTALGIVKAQAIASSFEIGVHNGTLAIFVAVEVLDNVEISIPAAVYSVLMFPLAALWGMFVSRRVGAADTVRA